jgi:hypothetical protein
MLAAHLKAIEEQARWCYLFGSTEAQVEIHDRADENKQIDLACLLTEASYAITKDGDNFFISKDVLKTVAECAANIPHEIKWEDRWFPTNCGWMHFEEPVMFEVMVWVSSIQDVIKRSVPAIAMGWGRTVDENGVEKALIILYTIIVCTYENPETSMHYMVVIQDDTLDAHIAATETQTSQGAQITAPWIYSMFYVMAQPVIAGVNYEKASSLARSMVSRKSKAPVRPDVRIITLRRRMTPHSGDTGKGHRNIEWSCRWLVGADFKHWRKQFYSSTGEHKYIHIPPFVKGPADKPLKQPSKTFYQVTR